MFSSRCGAICGLPGGEHCGAGGLPFIRPRDQSPDQARDGGRATRVQARGQALHLPGRPPGELSASVHEPGRPYGVGSAVPEYSPPSRSPALAGPAWAAADWPRANAGNAFSAMLCNFHQLHRLVAHARHLDEGLSDKIVVITQFSIFVKKLFSLCSFRTRAAKAPKSALTRGRPTALRKHSAAATTHQIINTYIICC